MATSRVDTGLPVAPPAARGTVLLLVAAAVGAAVSVALGVYAKVHDPTNEQIAHYGFPTLLSMKAWLTTGAFVLAIVQALSAAWMWGRLPRAGAPPRWVAHAHRWTGTAAFLLVLPVAYHCLWSLGWRDTDARVLVHGILGCAFFGALAVKLLALRINGLAGWVLPVLGGGLVAILTAIWLTSSLWFFTNIGFPGL
ncbi:MAG: DUF6529 family protein [Ilumatobacteraceae bacterium]